jgi:hypothetical protein
MDITEKVIKRGLDGSEGQEVNPMEPPQHPRLRLEVKETRTPRVSAVSEEGQQTARAKSLDRANESPGVLALPLNSTDNQINAVRNINATATLLMQYSRGLAETGLESTLASYAHFAKVGGESELPVKILLPPYVFKDHSTFLGIQGFPILDPKNILLQPVLDLIEHARTLGLEVKLERKLINWDSLEVDRKLTILSGFTPARVPELDAMAMSTGLIHGGAELSFHLPASA